MDICVKLRMSGELCHKSPLVDWNPEWRLPHLYWKLLFILCVFVFPSNKMFVFCFSFFVFAIHFLCFLSMHNFKCCCLKKCDKCTWHLIKLFHKFFYILYKYLMHISVNIKHVFFKKCTCSFGIWIDYWVSGNSVSFLLYEQLDLFMNIFNLLTQNNNREMINWIIGRVIKRTENMQKFSADPQNVGTFSPSFCQISWSSWHRQTHNTTASGTAGRTSYDCTCPCTPCRYSKVRLFTMFFIYFFLWLYPCECF